MWFVLTVFDISDQLLGQQWTAGGAESSLGQLDPQQGEDRGGDWHHLHGSPGPHPLLRPQVRGGVGGGPEHPDQGGPAGPHQGGHQPGRVSRAAGQPGQGPAGDHLVSQTQSTALLCHISRPPPLCPPHSPPPSQGSPRLRQRSDLGLSPAGPGGAGGTPRAGEESGGSQWCRHLPGGRAGHLPLSQSGRLSQALEPRPAGGGGGAREGPAGSPLSSQ